MPTETIILQHWIFTKFVFPFLLVFFLTYGILTKTKLLGEGKQLNAGVAFFIGMIFVGAVYPKLVVSNMILFLTIALVVMFVALLLWGFVAGEDGLKFSSAPNGLKWFIGIVIIASVLIALLWAMGIEHLFFGNVFDFLFNQPWSGEVWTNLAFIVVIIVSLVLILKSAGTK